MSRSVAELKEIAKELGLKIKSNVTKENLAYEILDQQAIDQSNQQTTEVKRRRTRIAKDAAPESAPTTTEQPAAEAPKRRGRKPKATDQVKCHYEGMLVDGTLFDSSLQRGEPATFPLNGVIAGWTEGLQLMQEGAKYRFFIPSHLGYGERGAGQSIPPFAALIFDVELIEVI